MGSSPLRSLGRRTFGVVRPEGPKSSIGRPLEPELRVTRPSYPVFDADHHLYEAPEVFTEYLPKAHRRDIQFVQVRGRTKIAVKGRLTEFMPNPTFERVARPGCHMPYYSGNNPEASPSAR
jgi:hypothetical protein